MNKIDEIYMKIGDHRQKRHEVLEDLVRLKDKGLTVREEDSKTNENYKEAIESYIKRDYKTLIEISKKTDSEISELAGLMAIESYIDKYGIKEDGEIVKDLELHSEDGGHIEYMPDMDFLESLLVDTEKMPDKVKYRLGEVLVERYRKRGNMDQLSRIIEYRGGIQFGPSSEDIVLREDVFLDDDIKKKAIEAYTEIGIRNECAEASLFYLFDTVDKKYFPAIIEKTIEVYEEILSESEKIKPQEEIKREPDTFLDKIKKTYKRKDGSKEIKVEEIIDKEEIKKDYMKALDIIHDYVKDE